MSAQQDTLFGAPPEPVRLGPRQHRALDLIDEAGWEGVTADEVGADVHAAKGQHGLDTRCDYCGRDGRSILRSLSRHGLVSRRRSGGWTRAARPPRNAAAGPSNEFPEGF